MIFITFSLCTREDDKQNMTDSQNFLSLKTFKRNEFLCHFPPSFLCFWPYLRVLDLYRPLWDCLGYHLALRRYHSYRLVKGSTWQRDTIHSRDLGNQQTFIGREQKCLHRPHLFELWREVNAKRTLHHHF